MKREETTSLLVNSAIVKPLCCCGFLVVIMRFGIVPSLLVPNAKMLFVLISCLLSRSESEEVQTLLDCNADLVCVCGRELQCVGEPPQSGSVLIPAAAACWIRLPWHLKNLKFSTHTSAMS